MIASNLKRGALALLLFASASCESSTEPDDGTSSSDFSLLVERRNAAGQRSYYVLSGDGKRFTPFNAPADARALIPAPDGKAIAYLRDITTAVELWVMDRDGNNKRALLTAGGYVIESVSWSPNSGKLAVAYSTETVSNNIGIINADGTGFVDLTPDPLPGVYIDRSPSWSPDGTKLAFSSNRSGTSRLWIMNADGSNPHQVLPQSFPSNERQPVWAPDTTNFIAVVSSTGGGPGIAFVRADGTDFKHVPIPAGPNDPVWLPDGRLMYVANSSGTYDLWTVDRVSGVTTRVTDRSDNDVHAAVYTDVTPYTWLGFNAAVTYQINRPFAVDMIAADVLTDGRPDVLILSPILNEIRLMRGGINGNLQSVGSLFVETDVSVLRTALISPDNAPDIVGRGDSIAYLWRGRADGPGVAAPIPMVGTLKDVALSDLDVSGKADIISLVENNPSQPFRIKIHTVGQNDVVSLALNQLTIRTNGHSLCAGDFTGDALPDIAVFTGTTTLNAYVSVGRGELTVGDLGAFGAAFTNDLNAVPYCADFNNDGRDDAALFSTGAVESVSVFKSSGSGFGSVARIATNASAVAFVDVDNDGDLDVISASTNTASIFVAKNRGTGTFDAPTAYPIANIPIAIASADLNGDNWPDVLVVDVTGTLIVLMSKGRAGM